MQIIRMIRLIVLALSVNVVFVHGLHRSAMIRPINFKLKSYSQGLCMMLSSTGSLGLSLSYEYTNSLSTSFVPSIATDSVDVIQKYDAQLPSNEVLFGFVGLSVLLSIVALYWWNIIIPQKRTELAISKSRGDINNLLKELENTTSFSNGSSISNGSSDDVDENSRITATTNIDQNFDMKLKRWFFTDWLQQRKKRTAKPAAIPFLKKAKWNSGDNPILVAFGSVMALVIASSIAERTFH